MKVILSWLMRYAKVIILSFITIGSIFVNSSLLTDSQILPKCFCLKMVMAYNYKEQKLIAKAI